jgi:hypothetical protein
MAPRSGREQECNGVMIDEGHVLNGIVIVFALILELSVRKLLIILLQFLRSSRADTAKINFCCGRW